MMRYLFILIFVFLSAGLQAQYVVNNNGDQGDVNPGDDICDIGDGTCTLRAAIQEANATAGSNTIIFDAAMFGVTIAVDSELRLETTTETTINGDIDGDQIPDVRVQAGNTAINGFELISDNHQILNLNIDGFVGGAAVFIQSRYDTIAGNFIGTDLTGTKPGTGNNYGVHITLTSDAVIGGLDTKEGNVISNNTIGVYHDGSDGDRVLNNKIGTDYAGNIAITNNPAGIYAVNANDIDVGATGSGNVISGNFSQGVNFAGVTSSSIRDNLIGTSSDGFSSIANDVGILIDGKSSSVSIGGNVVSGNVNAGIDIASTSSGIWGNIIGLDILGSDNLPNDGDGIYIRPGAEVTVGFLGNGYVGRNIISSNDGDGINIAGGNNTIIGNFIGLSKNGQDALGNVGNGINISTPATDQQIIGTSDDDHRNIISGNFRGINIGASSLDIIENNYIGTDSTGTMAHPNLDFGIVIAGDNHVIGTASGPNIISGNLKGGIQINGPNTVDQLVGASNEIFNNLIGTKADGVKALSNGGHGVHLLNASFNNLNGNTIAFNSNTGITVEGPSALENITDDVIYSNTNLGIDLLLGAHGGLPDPVIGNGPDELGNISGTAAFSNATIKIYADADNEGKYLLSTVTADASGNWSTTLDMNTIPDTLSFLTVLENPGTGKHGFSRFSNAATVPVLPIVTSISPTSGQLIPNTSDLVITFSDLIDGTTVNASTILVQGNQSGVIGGSFSGGGTNTITFTPTNPYRPNERILITVTTGVTNTSGVKIYRPYSAMYRGMSLPGPSTPNRFVEETAFDIPNTLDGPRYVNALDLDQDGDIDLLATAGYNDTQAWYENDGSDNYTEHIISTTANGDAPILAFDIDEDGDVDIVSSETTGVSLYTNDGAENFSQSIIGSSSEFYDVTDLDGDGDYDVISASGGIKLLRNNGSEVFTEIGLTRLMNVRWFEMADLNRDGHMDFVLQSRSPDGIFMFINDGLMNFEETLIIPIGSLFRKGVYVADINADTHLDLVLVGTGVYLNDGKPNFTLYSVPDSPLMYDNSGIGTPLDLDGDGDWDILTADQGADFITWNENNGTGAFTNKHDIHVGQTLRDEPRGLAVVDRDGDGDLDILIGSQQDDQIGWFTNSVPPPLDADIVVYNGPTNLFDEIVDGQLIVIDIGSVRQGSDLNYQFSIENQGEADLLIDSVVFSNPVFSTVIVPPLVAGASYDEILEIQLSGLTDGLFSSRVSIYNSDPDEGVFDFFISGTILPPLPDLANIYWVDAMNWVIKSSELDGTGVQSLYSNDTDIPVALDIDTVNNLIYWSTSTGKVFSAEMTASGLNDVLLRLDNGDDGSYFSGISFNAETGDVFLIDIANSEIKSANLYATNPQLTVTPIHGITGTVHGLDINTTTGKLYYVETVEVLPTYDADLLESNFDGSGQVSLHSWTTTSNTGGFDIKVDNINNQVYWSLFDDIGVFIFSANPTDVLGTLSSFATDGPALGIDLDIANNEIYWVDAEIPSTKPSEIKKSALDGSNPQILISGVPTLGAPTYMALDVLGTQPTPCVNPPTVDNGTTANLCGGDVIIVSGTIGGSATSATWSTTGDGSFDDPTLLDATYAAGPGDISDGTVTLILTTDDPDGTGNCVAASSSLILTITPEPTLTIPADFAICESVSPTLTSTLIGPATQITWTTPGDGSFDDPSILSPVYTPGPTDIMNGSVNLSIQVNSNGCIVNDQVLITIEQAHMVDPGVDQAICPGDVVSLTGILGGSASAAIWSTTGDGSFGDGGNLNTTYTPGSTDMGNGSVSILLSSLPGTCEAVSNTLVVNISQPITAVAQDVDVNIGTPTLIDLSANGTFTTSDVLTATITSPATKGTLQIVSGITVQYEANAGTVGADSFNFTICNQCNLCSDAVASIQIANVPPAVAVASSQTNSGSVITIDVLGFVTDLNDNVDPNSLRVVSQPSSGATATFDNQGVLTIDYTDVNFAGTDVLSIEVCDLDGLCVTQEIQIEVTEPSVVFYNAVSPNNDGKHDFLEIENADFFPNNRLVIMNRWGDVVFEITGYDNQNNIFAGEGNIGGAKDLPAGTYYYSFTTGEEGASQMTGYFSLRK